MRISKGGTVIVLTRPQTTAMFRNFLKTALRSLIRNKGFTFINIFGLVLGISFSTMLWTYVNNELSYDAFHSKADRTFRVLTTDKSNPHDIRTYAITTPALGPELVHSFPEVEAITRLHRFSGQVIVQTGDENFNERNWFSTSDSNFFNVFDFEMTEGDKSTALRDPFSVILTESIARKYFSDGKALGREIDVLGYGPAKVTGVIKDIPNNSHLKFDLLFSNLRSGPEWQAYLNNWDQFGAATYVVLKEGGDIGDITARLPALMQKHWGPDAGIQSTSFQALTDIYLHSEAIQSGVEQEHGEMSYVLIFSSMAILLLLLAAINYVNLTTSKAASRAKEIGVRKVAGAFKSQLAFQFMTEALLVTVAAMVISVAVINLCFPFFNSITGKAFELTLNNISSYVPALATITIVIGLLAGIYPAFYLSRLKPVSTLKGLRTHSTQAIDFRSGLVVFQFTITIALIVSTLTIGRQMKFIQTRNIGFDKEGLMIVDINNGNVRKRFQAMKNEFLNLPGVEHVSVSSRVPGEWKNIREVYVTIGESGMLNNDSLHTFFMGFDEDMLTTYNLSVAQGHYFSGNTQSDSSNVVINAAAAKALALENPVGSTLRISTDAGPWQVKVIGVLDDFNFQSLHQRVAPIIIGYRNNPIQEIDYFTLKVSGNIEELVAGATAVHDKFDSATPIEYHFLTDQLNNFYTAEKKAGMIFQMAGILSMAVACLGLLGLVTYHLERKTKELGIRKVLGAGRVSLFLLVYRAFAKQIVLAFLLACPIGWYVMNDWLNAFEYRIPLNAGLFIVAGVLVVVIVTVTVSYHALKAAMFNPVDQLRNE